MLPVARAQRQRGNVAVRRLDYVPVTETRKDNIFYSFCWVFDFSACERSEQVFTSASQFVENHQNLLLQLRVTERLWVPTSTSHNCKCECPGAPHTPHTPHKGVGQVGVDGRWVLMLSLLVQLFVFAVRADQQEEKRRRRTHPPSPRQPPSEKISFNPDSCVSATVLLREETLKSRVTEQKIPVPGYCKH